MDGGRLRTASAELLKSCIDEGSQAVRDALFCWVGSLGLTLIDSSGVAAQPAVAADGRVGRFAPSPARR